MEVFWSYNPTQPGVPMHQQIAANRDNPEVLEELYRNSPEVFSNQLERVFEAHLASPFCTPGTFG